MLKVIKYLQTHSLEDLVNEFGIVIKRYDDRVMLNYHQLDSPKFHPITKECRGLILSYPEYKVLSRGFDRFFNYGEGLPEEYEDFKMNRVVTYTKEDGSYIHIYRDDKRWYVGTRGSAFGETMVGNFNISFHDLVLKALNIENINDIYKELDSEFTYIFELTGPYNRVVKNYTELNLYFLAARSKINPDIWLPPEIIPNYWSREFMNKIKLPKIYTFENIDQVTNSMKELPPLDEGYVCWDKGSNKRFKLKNPSYVAIHHLKMNGSLTAKNVCYLIFQNEYEEYLTYYPEDRKVFDNYNSGYKNLIHTILNIYSLTREIKDQKEFALKIKDDKHSKFIFELRKRDIKNKITSTEEMIEVIKNILNSMKIESVIDFIEKYISEKDRIKIKNEK